MSRKGYGRIYVQKEEDIERVKQFIADIDASELNYLPKDLITTSDKYPELVYTGKFCDIDLEQLSTLCFSAGIMILFVNAKGSIDYLDKPYKDFHNFL
jgi:hypothetical protein